MVTEMPEVKSFTRDGQTQVATTFDTNEPIYVVGLFAKSRQAFANGKCPKGEEIKVEFTREPEREFEEGEYIQLDGNTPTSTPSKASGAPAGGYTRRPCRMGIRCRHTSRCGVQSARRATPKNQKSRRTIALPAYVVGILTAYRTVQIESRKKNGHKWQGIVYVFGTRNDTVKDAKNVRRYFKAITEAAEIEGDWVPRELRHTFVSWMSDQGASDELIADLVGHKKTSTTRTVYRHQLRPVITKGAELLDKAFGDGFEEAELEAQWLPVWQQNAPGDLSPGAFLLVVDTGIEPVTPRV